jgi:hypothetical protein
LEKRVKGGEKGKGYGWGKGKGKGWQKGTRVMGGKKREWLRGEMGGYGWGKG